MSYPKPCPTPSTPARAKHRSASRHGFTLVELLVVMGVLAVQAAILMPALARVRTSARGVGCLGNLRQWGLATQAYAADHEDFLPPEGAPNPSDRDTNRGWYIQLPREAGISPYHHAPWRTNPASPPEASLFLCPSNRRVSNGRNLFHYCLNRHVDGSGSGDAAVRLSALPEPARLVWLFDSKNLPAVGSWSHTHTNLHGGGAQFLFLDGHVRRLPAAVYWDPVTRRGRTNTTDLVWIP
jgi:prepilin-type N-terminal cleavage/methylation domain-containing protein/prepilin-type processing-associated H-X9-DG protein